MANQISQAFFRESVEELFNNIAEDNTDFPTSYWRGSEKTNEMLFGDVCPVNGEVYPEPHWEERPDIEEFIKKVGAKIVHHRNSGSYFLPFTDIIVLPPKCDFPNAQMYYSVLFHELTHWTGRSDRLSRFPERVEVSGNKAERVQAAKEEYLRYHIEEMIAETGSTILCKHFNLNVPMAKHASYAQGYWGGLDFDIEAFKFSAMKTWEAVNFLFEKAHFSA